MCDIEGDRLLPRSDHRVDLQMVGSGELVDLGNDDRRGGQRLVVATLE